MDSTLPLTEAVVAALGADATLMALGAPPLTGRVYNRPRADVVFPYISARVVAALPWETDDWAGIEATIQVDVWSRSAGTIEAQAIQARVHEALHQTGLTLDGHALVLLQLELARMIEDPDGLTTHGVSRFTALTHPD